MAFITLTRIKYPYFLICLIATIVLSIYSIHRYSLNEDSTVVKVTKYLSSNDAIYPSFSFCILPPFLKDRFEAYGDSRINMTSYINFLEGKLWDERMLMVDYDNVTVSLSENLISAEYKKHQKRHLEDDDWNPDHYVSFRASNRKCFTVDAPISDMGLIWRNKIKIKHGIFPDERRSPANEIRTYLHYPRQRITGYYTVKNDFESRENNSNNYKMEFQVLNVGVITRRNKKHDFCVEDWKHYEQKFMEFRMNKIGCRPPHWKMTSVLPTCSSAKQMKSYSLQPSIAEVESFDPPCKVIDQLYYTYSEHNLNKKG